MGAGSVGCYVGGRLAGAGADVVLVGRERLAREVGEHGLVLEDLRLPTVRIEKEEVRFVTDAGALADREVVLCCVKSAATPDAADRLARVLAPGTLVVSLQNGVRNADELRRRLEQPVLAGIVEFNVLSKGRGVFRRATSGSLVIERASGPLAAEARASELARALERAGLDVERDTRIRELQWSKLLINSNNAVSALSGRPTKELVLSAGYRRILSSVMLEALGVLRRAGIRPASLGPLPIGVIAIALRLPTPLVRVVARTQLEIDPEARSSMWEDLAMGRPTEIDWINGEIVRLAEAQGVDAPLNRRLVEIVREAERAGRGSPALSAEELWRRLRSGDSTPRAGGD